MSLIVCAASQVDAVFRQRRPSHVVSLISPDAAAPHLDLAAGRHLVLRFNDIIEPRPGLTAPSPAMLARLLAFAEARAADGPLLIHCYAGVSRSPAAAYVIACARGPAGREADLALTLRRRSPWATPNAGLVALADTMLGRRGAMVRAIAGIGRGADASEGEVFEYP